MSWEVQGRQYHQWFGHGTGNGADVATAPGPGDVAGAVGSAAVAALGARGGALARVLAEGGARDLTQALPIWVASSGLAPERFRALLVGNGVGAAGAASLQAMARVLAGAGEGGHEAAVAEAGRHLAAALGGEREGRWRYGLNYARDKAVYAAANGFLSLVPPFTQTNEAASGLIIAERALPEGKKFPRSEQTAGMTSPIWAECHAHCVELTVGKGYGADAPQRYRRCMRECGAIP